MICPKCKSDNVNIQAVSVMKNKNKGCMYWLIVGWWLQPILWLFFTLPMLIVGLFGRKKTQTKIHSEAICQSCGNRWKI